jgi:phosphate ABC transporter permease protein PstC
MEAGALRPRGDGRSRLERPSRERLADPAFRWVLTCLAAGILILVGYFFIRLIGKASPAFSRFGVFGFTFADNWDPAHDVYGALPLLVGTIVTSAIALLIGVPIAIGTALYATELCPRRLRPVLRTLLDLLAAVPSVVYGLWGFLFLAPKLHGVEQFFADKLSFIPFIGGGSVTNPNYFIAGLILAIMILPIVSAISREVMATVPSDHKEAALALGATRWEMIRTAVLPYSRAGITGATMLGLGRALGETIAVTLVIGQTTEIPSHIFNQGQSLAGVIANEFGEATPIHVSALIAAGLVLFVLTLAVNAFARAYVVRAGRTQRAAAVGVGA